ncbi:hypothetical protein Fot_14547 [Forsythia ovata]|uniref:Uncharacterized protein n=1 Tax=Forsythia ovata TaxID=205694 RepID=A0ABD1W6N5_9LAMI
MDIHQISTLSPQLGYLSWGKLHAVHYLNIYLHFDAKINFTKPKKNPTHDPTPKVVQTKISMKAKSPPPVKGVVIKEPSPNFGRPTQDEVSNKGKKKAVEPPPKVKPTSKQAPSSSKTTQLGSSS